MNRSCKGSLSNRNGWCDCFCCTTYGRAGWRELLQHVGDDNLQQSLSEEFLAHSAAVIIIFLRRTQQKDTRSVTHGKKKKNLTAYTFHSAKRLLKITFIMLLFTFLYSKHNAIQKCDDFFFFFLTESYCLAVLFYLKNSILAPLNALADVVLSLRLQRLVKKLLKGVHWIVHLLREQQ